MEKLKPEYVKPYPIGVNGLLIRWHNESYGRMNGFLSQEKDDYFTDGMIWMVESEIGDIESAMPASTEQITLGLRPMSDIFTEITHKGKKFVPALILFPLPMKEELNFDTYGTIPDYWISMSKMNFKTDLEYGLMRLLFEWSFDVFGLIKEGYAFNLNEFNHES